MVQVQSFLFLVYSFVLVTQSTSAGHAATNSGSGTMIAAQADTCKTSISHVGSIFPLPTALSLDYRHD